MHVPIQRGRFGYFRMPDSTGQLTVIFPAPFLLPKQTAIDIRRKMRLCGFYEPMTYVPYKSIPENTIEVR